MFPDQMVRYDLSGSPGSFAAPLFPAQSQDLPSQSEAVSPDAGRLVWLPVPDIPPAPASPHEKKPDLP